MATGDQHTQTSDDVRLYDDEGELLMSSDQAADRVTLLPPAYSRTDPKERIRILWGQDMLSDLLSGRYRVMVCGVNDEDNSHGIIAQIVDMTTTSQWTAKSATSYAKMFHEAISIHAAEDREPYILKYDLDSMLILAILRPKGRDHFTIEDLKRGFQTVTKMLRNREERQPVASVSFLGARSNRLIDPATGQEPSFETVLRTMYEAGYRGDIYPSPPMWRYGHVGVFPSFPFPEGLDTMRAGGF
ncbi:MAG: hypothetical protein EA376_13385 [Phycisphaeraceae bacterium]|nr:MAG: hypothetical protein EA376_13385 [Phycisphaeraceae bacterium]